MGKSFKAKFIFILALVFVCFSQNNCLAVDNLVNKKHSLIGKSLSEIVSGKDIYSDIKDLPIVKLDTALNKLFNTAEQGVSYASDFAKSTGFKVKENKIWVLIIAKPDQWEEARSILLKAGAEGLKTSMRRKRRLRCWLPITSLATVAANDAVSYLRRPSRPIANQQASNQQYASGVANAYANRTSEALAAMGVSDWHDKDHKGQGIKVGVIDAGFLGYTALKGTALPSTITVKNFVEGEGIGAVDGTNLHGTACAEVIHDIAPLSELYLVKIDDLDDVEEAVDWLINQQVDVVSVSLGFNNADAGDGETPAGLFAEEITRARNNGLLFVASAGNYRRFHWGGTFNPLQGYWGSSRMTFHIWGDTLGYINCIGSGGTNFPYDCDQIISGVNPQVYFRWAGDWDEGAGAIDYDLYLVRWDSTRSTWVIVAESFNYQRDGAFPPTEEIIDYITTGEDTYYGVFVDWWGHGEETSVNLDLFVTITQYDGRLRHYKTERSLSGGLAEATAAVAVTAVNVAPPYAQEYYSGEGPRNGLGGTAGPATAQKPDLAGYANVSTVSYGTANFGGTSAATPHVAGAVALILENYDFSSFTKVVNYLHSRAKPLGDPGWDTIYGHGRVHMGSPDDTQNDHAIEAILMLLIN
ncbi:MAG: S8 family serine peptidase [Desulfobacteraceae bacterium]|nr:S8 family serine peptidase [Desulfobacteraceae bacterium]